MLAACWLALFFSTWFGGPKAQCAQVRAPSRGFRLCLQWEVLDISVPLAMWALLSSASCSHQHGRDWALQDQQQRVQSHMYLHLHPAQAYPAGRMHLQAWDHNKHSPRLHNGPMASLACRQHTCTGTPGL